MRSLIYLDVEYRELPDHSRIWVSLYGHVASTKPKNGRGPEVTPRPFKVRIDKDGYPRLYVSGPRAAGRQRRLGLHVAVLSAWDRPRPSGEVARHLNGVREECYITNLAWGTPTQNYADTRLHGRLKGRGNPASKMTEADVIRLRQERQHKPAWQLVKENPQWSKFAVWAAITGYSWAHLPGAVSQGRRCSKNAWRAGVKLR